MLTIETAGAVIETNAPAGGYAGACETNCDWYSCRQVLHSFYLFFLMCEQYFHWCGSRLKARVHLIRVSLGHTTKHSRIAEVTWNDRYNLYCWAILIEYFYIWGNYFWKVNYKRIMNSHFICIWSELLFKYVNYNKVKTFNASRFMWYGISDLCLWVQWEYFIDYCVTFYNLFFSYKKIHFKFVLSYCLIFLHLQRRVLSDW